MAAIEVRALTKSFQVVDRDAGLRGAATSVIRRRHRTITAVDDVSFDVHHGEIVAFLGPNGAGKTTTLKCVAGLLEPTSGSVRSLGFNPIERKRAYLQRLGFVMGQRWQLHLDLPIEESFDVLRVMYDIPHDRYVRTRDELVEMLDLGDLLGQPFRQLSLGQRMRAEFAGSLLHTPDLVLLDEPTLGLDFDGQAKIREFVTEYVKHHNAAVVLTSHYLVDIETMADRVYTIAGGRITFRGTYQQLKERTGDRKIVTARLRSPLDDSEIQQVIGSAAQVHSNTDHQVVIEVSRAESGPTISGLQSFDQVIDVTLGDPNVEEVLAELYQADAPRADSETE